MRARKDGEQALRGLAAGARRACALETVTMGIVTSAGASRPTTTAPCVFDGGERGAGGGGDTRKNAAGYCKSVSICQASPTQCVHRICTFSPSPSCTRSVARPLGCTRSPAVGQSGVVGRQFPVKGALKAETVKTYLQVVAEVVEVQRIRREEKVLSAVSSACCGLCADARGIAMLLPVRVL